MNAFVSKFLHGIYKRSYPSFFYPIGKRLKIFKWIWKLSQKILSISFWVVFSAFADLHISNGFVLNGLVLHFVLPFGPETSGSKEDSVSREELAAKDPPWMEKFSLTTVSSPLMGRIKERVEMRRDFQKMFWSPSLLSPPTCGESS